MKETPLATCERDFTVQVIKQKRRLDGRGAYDYRNLKISFGVDYGCCNVSIGDTLVMAQVSCSLVEPKHSRTNEGLLRVNIEFNHVACPGYEPGRMSKKAVQINRLLERCLKESRCIDMESLCVIAERQVWEIRLDVHVLNHDGNILDACSIASMAALCHFRRPEISIDDGKITIHPPEEKEYIPLSILHMPISTSFSYFSDGLQVLVDASYSEERVVQGQMVIAMNKHREICALLMSGTHLLLKEQVSHCTKIAASKVLTITELIQLALSNDKEAREKGQPSGSAELKSTANIDDLIKGLKQNVKLKPDKEKSEESEDEQCNQKKSNSTDENQSRKKKNPTDEQWKAAQKDAQQYMEQVMDPKEDIGTGQVNTWQVSSDSENKNLVKATTKRKRNKKKKQLPADDSLSEEEETMTLEGDDL